MHDLETFGEEAAFASFREPAWHGLGTVFTEPKTAQEIVEASYCAGWDVHLEPVTVGSIPAERFAVPAYAVVRTNPFDGAKDVLSVVGERYRVVQNEEVADFGDALGSGARWETFGSIKKGRVVFGSLALERSTVIDPNGVADKVDLYLLMHTSHDGSVAVQASITPVRVVCANTLNFALRSVKQSFKVRHTQTVEGKLAAAREALGMAERYMDDFDLAAQVLFETPVTAQDINDIVEKVYPAPDKDAAKAANTRYENKMERIFDVLTGPTSDGIQDTAWGLLNALTEDLDWNRGIRNENPESKLAAASGLDPIANANRNRIFKIVKEFAGI